MKILIVIDMQNDFIYGTLKSDNAINILNYVRDKINNFDGKLIYTKDTHDNNYLKTQEGRNLPIEHCIKGSYGWDFAEGIYKHGSLIFEKNCFSSKDMAFYLEKLNLDEKIESIELIGICTDICVITNAMLLKSLLPEVQIYVDSKACAGTSVENHLNALKAMSICQIKIK